MPTYRKPITVILLISQLMVSGCSEQRNKDTTSRRTDTMNAAIIKSVDVFKNRPIYSKLTAGIVAATPDSTLLQTVFDNLSTKLPRDQQHEYETVMSWTKPQQAIYISWVLEAEVNNGGFNQYYFNQSGQFANLTPDALTLVGAMRLANLAVRANEIYKTNKEQIIRHQDGSLEGFAKSYDDNPLGTIDDEFYDLQGKENLQELQIAYIRSHVAYFIDK